MNLRNMSFFGNGHEYADEQGAASKMQFFRRLVKLIPRPNNPSAFPFHYNFTRNNYKLVVALYAVFSL